MKRFLLIFALFCGVSMAAFAQNGYKNAIGVRAGWGAEISYQRYLGSDNANSVNRIEAGIGVNRYGFNTGATFQWVFDLPIETEGIWQWYVGGGAALGGWDTKKFGSGFSLGITAQGGFEYSFADIPLLLSIDYRPGFYFLPEAKFDWTGFAAGVRFCF